MTDAISMLDDAEFDLGAGGDLLGLQHVGQIVSHVAPPDPPKETGWAIVAMIAILLVILLDTHEWRAAGGLTQLNSGRREFLASGILSGHGPVLGISNGTLTKPTGFGLMAAWLCREAC